MEGVSYIRYYLSVGLKKTRLGRGVFVEGNGTMGEM